MRKLYTIVALLLFVTTTIYAQDPNNHWQLGTADVNFTTNPPTVATVANSGQYGNASISDDFGNLLFYTDGNTVWNKNNGVMPLGTNISYNPLAILILPNLGNPNQYFIFTAYKESNLCIPCSSYVKYQYAIVDFSDALNPLGKVVISSQDLLTNYSANFAPLTFVKNATNDGYFVIIHTPSSGSGGTFSSYKITNTGLNLTPIQTIITNDIGYLETSGDSGTTYNSTSAIIKFSPENTKIGELLRIQSRSPVPNSPYTYSSRFFTLDFNNSTGTFSNYSFVESSSNTASTDFEFSSDSKKVYFALDNIYVKDLLNITSPARNLTDTNNTTSVPSGFNHLQRDKYGNIFISSQSSTSTLNRNKYLHKIDNQDSFSTSSVNLNYISLNGYAIPSGNFYLPQLIPELSLPCINDVIVTANVPSGTDKKQASNTIKASNILNSGAKGIYHAGTSVTLTNGFNAKTGSVFKAYIAGCTNTFTAKKSNGGKTAIFSENIKISSVKLYPNPNTGIFTIDLGFENKNKIAVGIYDSFGKAVYNSSSKEAIFEINLPNLPSGLYIVKLQGDNYNETLKFIKE